MTTAPRIARPRPASSAALGRVLGRAATLRRDPAEKCDLCANPVADGHAHVLDERRDELLCACRACALLFERDAAGRGHYRLVPRRRVRLDGVPSADLGVPVGLAFFVREPDGGVAARCPSPAGATRWEVDPPVWAAAEARCEALRTMLPGVEALLVNTARGADEQWLVPVDDCHRLVAAVRRSWKGLSGGLEVWPEIERFFAELATNPEGK
ncbi:DUF5947 family protein [Actinomadura rugatobispora]|uniref:DUF5947 family protein n=1 Tax=Actinomadura rugatobispora TaxID=1994 RepID=A0ABW0ZZ71_9ACTN|nr:DUF5947 family protein [Actinomadura rugatobispora]